MCDIIIEINYYIYKCNKYIRYISIAKSDYKSQEYMEYMDENIDHDDIRIYLLILEQHIKLAKSLRKWVVKIKQKYNPHNFLLF